MNLLARKKILYLAFTVLVASAAPCAVAPVYGAETVQASSESPAFDTAYTDVSEFVKGYFKKAKVSKEGKKIHVEHKARQLINRFNKQELLPDTGGIVCDIELVKGKFKGKETLPLTNHEFTHTVLTLAPYVPGEDAHLLTRLYYPPDTPQDFLDRFVEMISAIGPSVNAESAQETAKASKTTGSTNKPVVASARPASSSSAAKTDAPAKSVPLFMWKATKDEATIYLVGTLSYARNKSWELAGGIEKAYQDAKCIVDVTEKGWEVKEGGYYKDGDKLSNHITDETKKVFDQYFAWSGESMSIYEVWKPLVAALAINMSTLRQDGFNPVSLESQIMRKAKVSSKPIVEIKKEMKDIKDSDAEVDQYLRLQLLWLMDFKREQALTEEAWVEGDLKKMDEACNLVTHQHPELEEALKKFNDEPNADLTKKLESLAIKKGTILVTTDVSDFCGSDSVIELLKKQGFNVEQVKGAPLREVPANFEISFRDPEASMSLLKMMDSKASTTPLEKVESAFDAGRYKDALKMLEGMPQTHEVHYWKGMCFMRQLQMVGASNELKIAAQTKDAKLKKRVTAALVELIQMAKGRIEAKINSLTRPDEEFPSAREQRSRSSSSSSSTSRPKRWGETRGGF